MCSYEINLMKNLNQPNYHNQLTKPPILSQTEQRLLQPFFWISLSPFYKSL